MQLESSDLKTDINEIKAKQEKHQKSIKDNKLKEDEKIVVVQNLKDIDVQIETLQKSLDSYNKILSAWKIAQVYNDGSLYAVLYSSIIGSTERFVLAYRGFSFAFKDLKKSESTSKGAIEGAIRNKVVSQHEVAYNIIKELGNGQYKDKMLSITGHTFGAWLAEISLFFALREFGFDKNRIRAVTFESFGSGQVVDNFKSNIKNKYTKFDINDLNILSYLTVPNPLNSINNHIGDVRRLSTKSDNAKKAGQLVEKVHVLKNTLKKVYDIKSNYVEGRIHGTASIFGSGLVNILETFDVDSG